MSDNTKEKIKNAAEELITRKGYKDTSVKDIAKSAEVAVGTIYRYYKSKDEILTDMGRLDLKDVSYSQDRRRKQIMEAALDVFGTKGYTRTNMEDIAREIGMSKGSIYQYFESKDKLFISMIKESAQMQTIFNRTENGTEQATIEDVLTGIGMTFLSIFKDPQKIKLVRVIIGESPNFPEIGELFLHGVVEEAAERLGKLLKLHVPSGMDPVLVVRLFIGSLWSFVMLQEMIPAKSKKYDYQDVVKNAVRIFRYGAFSKE
ncbi:TetR/AcrR family transcriptional regulator [Paenibacillus durus]|uniref:TetR family transcriptional regulator n=1 Tax=Paenibacillus durus TaxID=44251 RepID=A0A089HL12_PAEDU|nr:TetR/AcrR family transcriptional regulator [Paenibacillus durus]AIQ11078.1 TetR family transcriptional regulator [Paenibacillus durus]